MKQKTVIATLLLGLVACGDNNDAPAEVAPVPREPVAEATSVPTDVNAMLEEPLPPGVELHIPVQLRRDRSYTHDDGNPRRRVVLDLLEGDIAPTIAVVREAFVEAGFEAGELRDRPDGGSQIRFNKDEYGVAIAMVRPDWGDPSPNPSKYIVVLDLRPDPALDQ